MTDTDDIRDIHFVIEVKKRGEFLASFRVSALECCNGDESFAAVTWHPQRDS
jgi:hypothetical protein